MRKLKEKELLFRENIISKLFPNFHFKTYNRNSVKSCRRESLNMSHRRKCRNREQSILRFLIFIPSERREIVFL